MPVGAVGEALVLALLNRSAGRRSKRSRAAAGVPRIDAGWCSLPLHAVVRRRQSGEEVCANGR